MKKTVRRRLLAVLAGMAVLLSGCAQGGGGTLTCSAWSGYERFFALAGETYPEIPGPEYGGSFAMWQYSDGGTVPGIQTVVDLNVAYFGYEETVSTLEDNEAEK